MQRWRVSVGARSLVLPQDPQEGYYGPANHFSNRVVPYTDWTTYTHPQYFKKLIFL